jgi:hypothetical protein
MLAAPSASSSSAAAAASAPASAAASAAAPAPLFAASASPFAPLTSSQIQAAVTSERLILIDTPPLHSARGLMQWVLSGGGAESGGGGGAWSGYEASELQWLVWVWSVSHVVVVVAEGREEIGSGESAGVWRLIRSAELLRAGV